jgi:hypothetical protein
MGEAILPFFLFSVFIYLFNERAIFHGFRQSFQVQFVRTVVPSYHPLPFSVLHALCPLPLLVLQHLGKVHSENID